MSISNGWEHDPTTQESHLKFLVSLLVTPRKYRPVVVRSTECETYHPYKWLVSRFMPCTFSSDFESLRFTDGFQSITPTLSLGFRLEDCQYNWSHDLLNLM